MLSHHWARHALVLMLCASLVACGDDQTNTPAPVTPDMAQPDMTPEPDMMPEPDMEPEPDMAEPDMAPEPDMTMEPDMVVDPQISGDWVLRLYTDQQLGDVVATLALTNAMGSSEVLGTASQGGAEGAVAGTFTNRSMVALEWTANGIIYQFINGQYEGSQVVGQYGTGGLFQDAILVRP